MSGQIRFCQKCEQWRHVTAFARFAIFCRHCEAEESFDAEGRSWEDEQVTLALDAIRASKKVRVFDLAQSFQRAEEARIEAEVARILAGPRPKGLGGIRPKPWRFVHLRNEGKTLQEAATACKIDPRIALDLEREAMKELVARARMAIKRADDEREGQRHDVVA